jgi:AraC family transcriptional regulator
LASVLRNGGLVIVSSRRYGDAVAYSLGLKDAPILTARAAKQSQIAINRLSIGTEHFGMTPQIPPEDSFVVDMYLTEVPYHELWSRGRPFLAQGYAPNSLRIVNLVDEISAYISCPHESLVLYIPRAVLNDFTDEAGMGRVAHLRCSPGLVDPVMMHLAAALLPAFQRQHEASRLFVDHVSLVMLTHISDRYGGSRSYPFIRGGLTRLQANRAREFLAAHVAKEVALIDVARACGLSRGHFAKAFRVSTGLTPHQWLQRCRIDMAKEMLRKPEQPIVDIAASCGFADQSHLTRVFSRFVGASPAAWRRRI